jgi:hydroxymethylbilane synthase
MTNPAQTLRVGTRASELAKWQASRVVALLAARGVAATLVPIRTGGDDGRTLPGPGVTGKGLFTKEIEDALLAGQVDLAVHSLKDLPTEMPSGLTLAAFPERADVRDALVSRRAGGLEALPARARVGTSSLRRRAALLAARPDLEIVPLRGNVPTRVRRVGAGELDAVVVALAGLTRLGLADGAVPLDPQRHPPAPGQGALAVEVRAGDQRVLDLVRPLDDTGVRTAVVAERAALGALEGGCRAAIGAWCAGEGSGLMLHVRVYPPDGSRRLDASSVVSARDPEAAGLRAADQLLRAGAAELIRAGQAALSPEESFES